ncbi:hypothetical protein L226DRAFT_616678 [Lentinus tigrinus ALCF2SS1-7]|uniref:uncharacterized protein n=1 Tax=Lentinus tigrinus ALCF2SS1-7 TaxID=1328758 RepID=UPI001165E5B3|nr:hypothetical protein L226DRAFT_616678 [Lentinus tigrinus ALCF2SS1-7]
MLPISQHNHGYDPPVRKAPFLHVLGSRPLSRARSILDLIPSRGHVAPGLRCVLATPLAQYDEAGLTICGRLRILIQDHGVSTRASKKIISVTAAIQGSGWGWLGYNPDTKKLEIVTTPNQDPLLLHVPILGIDIWEHAFYLQYHKLKADYLTAIWNVINFKEADRRFVEAAKSVRTRYACLRAAHAQDYESA